MKRWTYAAVPLFAALTLSATAGPASAQYGLGWGGLYNPNDGSRVQAAVDQRALSQGNAAYANRPKAGVEPSFQQRDDSFYDKYDASTREAMIDRVARNPGMERSTARASDSRRPPADPRRCARPAPTTPPAPVSRVVRIGNFFDKNGQLIWPGESPSSGDLGLKRQAADLAATAVYNEFQSKGAATLETTAKARSQLLAYGRPALVAVREHSTPAMTDSFHAFLLTLYADLGDAYAIPAASAAR